MVARCAVTHTSLTATLSAVTAAFAPSPSQSSPLSLFLSPFSLLAMGYSTNSGPFWIGTLVFLIIGVVACFSSSMLAKAGRNQYLG